MRRFFDNSKELIKPFELVKTITKRPYEDLVLPKRAIIAFNNVDLRRILAELEHTLLVGWSPFRTIYKIKDKETIITKSPIGGPNIAAVVEEFSSFGVKEFILWGYCGGIKKGLKFGDTILAQGALREDGVSYHYVEDNEDDIVYSNWLDKWQGLAKDAGFLEGNVWSCDAIYRETTQKVMKYGSEGILAVEMEVASFYSVCKFRAVKGIAFLVVSDILTAEKWSAGFYNKQFKKGAKKLMDFLLRFAFI